MIEIEISWLLRSYEVPEDEKRLNNNAHAVVQSHATSLTTLTTLSTTRGRGAGLDSPML